MPMPSSARAQHVKTWRSLQKAHSSLVGDLDESLRGHGLTVNEFDVLVNLSPTQARRHLDLTSRVQLTRTALTRMIDRLIDRGLLERTPRPTPSRAPTRTPTLTPTLTPTPTRTLCAYRGRGSRGAVAERAPQACSTVGSGSPAAMVTTIRPHPHPGNRR